MLYAAAREQEGEHDEDVDRLMSLGIFSDEYAKPIADRALRARQVQVQVQVGDPTAPFRAWTAKHQDD